MYLGVNERNSPVNIDVDDLLTHGVVLGRTGSGKSGLTIALVEEAVRAGTNVVLFDPKGDLTNLALSLTGYDQFKSWVEDGVDYKQAFERHMRGIVNFGYDLTDVEHFRALADVSVYAPGRTRGGGQLLNIFPTFTPPRRRDTTAMREQARREVGVVLQALNESNDPFDPTLVYMTEAVLHHWALGQALPIERWPGVLSNPPAALQEFGGMPVNDFFPKARRTKLARKAIGFHHQADRWLSGDPLDLHRLVGQQRPQIAVFSMRHLSEEDRSFFTAIMMQKLVDFMFETSSSKKLKLLVVLDEARGYLPPHPYNPPTKDPICKILAQGRAQGIGMLIGTQNPMDLDYKALSNVGTWFVGRLRERDCARDLLGELNNRGVDIETLENMPQRRFLALDKKGNHHTLTVRWCLNYLRGPLDGQELKKLGASGLVLPPDRRGRLLRERVLPREVAQPAPVKEKPSPARKSGLRPGEFVQVIHVGKKKPRGVPKKKSKFLWGLL